MLNNVLSQTQNCYDVKPTKISDCTNNKLTEKDFEYFSTKYGKLDTCCYYFYKLSGVPYYRCLPLEKSNVNENLMKEEIIKDATNEGDSVDDFSIKCEPDVPVTSNSNSTNSTNSTSDSGSDSIWLSLSLTFLLFTLLF